MLPTTPGVAKYYRSPGPSARLRNDLRVGEGAALEYLPQDAMLFSGSRVEAETTVRQEGRARFIGWDMIRLGRPASGCTVPLMTSATTTAARDYLRVGIGGPGVNFEHPVQTVFPLTSTRRPRGRFRRRPIRFTRIEPCKFFLIFMRHRVLDWRGCIATSLNGAQMLRGAGVSDRPTRRT